MSQAALYTAGLEARLVSARVLEAQGELFRVLVGNAAHAAGLAASCLLRPESGDTVLLAELESGERLVLAVLFRDQTAPATLRLPPKSALRCEDMTLAAARLDLCGQDKLRLETRDMAVAAAAADVRVAEVHTLSDTVECCCRSLSSLGKTALSVFQSVTQCLGSSRRMVEGEDETRAGSSTLVADETVTVMSKNGLHLAEESSRTDAKLIQLG
jgi:hypothetical protein